MPSSVGVGVGVGVVEGSVGGGERVLVGEKEYWRVRECYKSSCFHTTLVN